MKKVLFLLTSSYPFGEGEAFLANEIPYLASEYDRIEVISNDTTGRLTATLPPSLRCHRHSYQLSNWEKVLSTAGILSGPVRREFKALRDRGVNPFDRSALSTVLVSWLKGRKFSRIIRNLALEHPESEIHAYSYWANDMALAAAVSRRRGWVHKAFCRAHGWDVYEDRAEVGFLPFRSFIAEELDHLLFVSEHGERYFHQQMGQRFPSTGHIPLGVGEITDHPLGRREPFTIVSCSSMIPLKRVEFLAGALGLLEEEVQWIHVGEGPSRTSVEEVVRQLPGNVRVDLRGQISNAEVLALFRDVRPSVFVSVSGTEGLPVSMMEAMSAGVPVMGTAVGGVPEIIEDGRNGFLLPADPRPQDVAEGIKKLVGLSQEAYQAYAEEAWHTWRDKFDAERNYRAFLERIGDSSPGHEGPS